MALASALLALLPLTDAALLLPAVRTWLGLMSATVLAGAAGALLALVLLALSAGFCMEFGTVVGTDGAGAGAGADVGMTAVADACAAESIAENAASAASSNAAAIFLQFNQRRTALTIPLP